MTRPIPKITWYQCPCGAEHDTPTCPFGSLPDACKVCGARWSCEHITIVPAKEKS